MFILDLRTLVLILGLTHLIQVLVFYFHFRTKNAYPGIGWWLMWSLAEAAGFIFILLRDYTAWLSLIIIIQNIFIVAGTLFLYFGVVLFVGKSIPYRLILPLILAFSGALFVFTFVIDHEQFRTVLISLSIAGLAFLSSYNLFTNKNRFFIFSSNFIATILLIHGSIFLYLTIMVITSKPRLDFLHPDFFNAIPFLDAILVSLLLTFGIIIMIHQRLTEEMKEAKINLRTSKSLFHLLFENMNEGVAFHEMIYDEKGNPLNYKILEVNTAFEKILGISSEMACGNLSTDVFNVAEAPYLNEYNNILQTNQAYHFETNFTPLKQYFSISAVPIGQLQFATIFMDISQNKNMEAESKRLLVMSERSREALLSILEDQLKVQESLNESNELLSLFIQHSPIFAFIKEVSPGESRVLKASDIFSEMIGIPGSKMVGKTMHELFPASFADKIVTDDWAVASEGKIFREDENLNNRNYTTIKFPIKQGSRMLLAGYTIDITDRIQAQAEIKELNETLEQRIALRTAQLEASNSELEAFSYSVSHDLRAPLRHINGFVDLLNKNFRQLLPDKGRHYLESISDASHQMNQLIDDLLQFSRAGRQEMHFSEFKMNVALQEAQNTFTNEIANRQIEWEIQNLPQVVGDINLIRLVWQNLLSNAIKFTKEKKPARIEIGYREENNENLFFIRDNGVGFDMKYAQKLFGVFQRLHPSSEFEGTGIGLANIRRIISKHGGRTWAEAKLNTGAVVYFTLPKKQ